MIRMIDIPAVLTESIVFLWEGPDEELDMSTGFQELLESAKNAMDTMTESELIVALIWQISANFPGKILLFPTPISHSICISIETCYYVCYCYRTAYLFTWSEGDLKVISWNRILITSFDRTPPSYHIDNTISLKYLVLWEIQWCTFCV